MLQNELCGVEDENSAALMDINLNEPTLLEFTDSNKIIRTGGSRKEVEEEFTPTNNWFPGHLIAKFFHGGYKTELANIIKQPSGNYKIQSNTHKEFYLNIIINKNTNRFNTRWEKNCECEFKLLDISPHRNEVVNITVNRCNDNIMNDGTYYTVKPTSRKIYKAREYYWMINDYIWEFIHKRDNVYHIKLVADDKPDLYLSKTGKDDVQTGVAEEWEVVGKQLKHVNSGLYLSVVNDEIKLSPTGTSFQFDID